MTTHRYSFQNKSDEVFPAYGCGRLRSILSTDAASTNPIYELVKPDGEEGIYVVNGPVNVAVDGFGVAVALQDAVLVLVDDGSFATAPEFGEICGPEEDRWAVTTLGVGLRATGERVNRIVPVTSVPSSSGGSSAESCPCECIGSGDLILHGVETTSRWTIKIGTEVFRQEFGFIHFPGGEYGVIWDPVAEKWTFDIGSLLTSTYLDGSDATADTTMDGELTMEFDGYGAPTVKLCVTGSVPDPE
jgi:hypothetical protein